MSDVVKIGDSPKHPEITEAKLVRIVEGYLYPNPEFTREMAKQLLKLKYNVDYQEPEWYRRTE